MGIPVGGEDDAESEGYSDDEEEEVLESIGDEEYEQNEAKEKQQQNDDDNDDDGEEEEEDDDEDDDGAIEASSMIHLIELSRPSTSLSLHLLNGKFEIVGAENGTTPPCVTFSKTPRRWRHTKKLKQKANKNVEESEKKSEEMTDAEAAWCAEQRLKDEVIVKQNRANGLSDMGHITSPTKENSQALPTVVTPQQSDETNDAKAHAEAEAIFCAPFLGSPEIKHSIYPPRNSRKNQRRASEIRPDFPVYSPEADRINPLLRGADGKVTGRMSPIKAPKRSPVRSPNSSSPRR
jgi:hypothetical protein